MKKIRPILCAIAIVALASNCKKTTVTPVCCVTPSSFSINFKAIYANKPMIIDKTYDYNGKKVRFTRLQFFMSYDLSSFDSPVGVNDNLPQTSLVKFTNLTDSAAAAAGVSIELPLANKTWTGLNFAIGVPKTINAKLPKDFTIPDPLADGGNFWDGWQSYAFTKLEGLMDKDGDGVFETGITLHTGANESFTPMKFAKTYAVTNGKITTVNFELDINEMLKNIDMTKTTNAQQVGDAATMKIIMTNYTTALTLK